MLFRYKLNKFIENDLKLDTSELIALQDTTAIPFELLKELQMRAGNKETLNDNKQKDMTMNKINAVIKAFLDGMGNLLSDDQKKEIHVHMEKSLKDKMIKDATETLGNAMTAMHLRRDEEAKKEILLQRNTRAAFKEVNKIKALLENIDTRLESNASKSDEKAKMSTNVSLDGVLGHMNKRLDSAFTNIKASVEKRREEELTNAISKVKALIKKDTTTINKLTDKRVNLTANLFNLEDMLTKLRNSNKSK